MGHLLEIDLDVAGHGTVKLDGKELHCMAIHWDGKASSIQTITLKVLVDKLKFRGEFLELKSAPIPDMPNSTGVTSSIWEVHNGPQIQANAELVAALQKITDLLSPWSTVH